MVMVVVMVVVMIIMMIVMAHIVNSFLGDARRPHSTACRYTRTACPHVEQNRAPGGNSVPQLEQIGTVAPDRCSTPHCAQKRAPGSSGALHPEQKLWAALLRGAWP